MSRVRKAAKDRAPTYLDLSRATQEDRYTCGYNQWYTDAQRDWNSYRGPPANLDPFAPFVA